jgi:hypothetical protein
MNIIGYEDVVFTRSAIRLHRAADKSLRRFAGESCAAGLKKVHSVSVLYRPAARQPQMIDTGMSHIGFRCIVRSEQTSAEGH